MQIRPDLNGYLEMIAWYKAGVPLAEILKAATINNALEFNLEHKYGTVEKGKIANLLILSENPLETIKAYDSIAEVIINGKLLKRERFSALNNK